MRTKRASTKPIYVWALFIPIPAVTVTATTTNIAAAVTTAVATTVAVAASFCISFNLWIFCDAYVLDIILCLFYSLPFGLTTIEFVLLYIIT